eukprot:6025296-Pyramimonas_sp.AAC.1
MIVLLGCPLPGHPQHYAYGSAVATLACRDLALPRPTHPHGWDQLLLLDPPTQRCSRVRPS